MNSGMEDENGKCNDSVWVTIRDIELTEHEKSILKNGEKLTDKHINAAQRLLYAQFPTLEGLELTLVAPHHKLCPNGIHAFFVHNNHWIVLFTIDCSPGQVDVFDSIYTSHDDSTLTALPITCAVESPGSSVTVKGSWT